MTSQSSATQSTHFPSSRPDQDQDRTASADTHADEESGRTVQAEQTEEEYEKQDEKPAQDDEQDNPELRLQNTKSSIAVELPLGKEIVFIAVVCMAQFMTVSLSIYLS